MSNRTKVLWGHRMMDSEIDTLLTEQGVGTLSMAGEERAYSIPMSFGYDAPEKLYFLFAGHSEEGNKVAYAEQTDTASFVVFDVESPSTWRSVVVEGSLSRITPPEWDTAREAMADNAYQGELIAGVDRQEDPRVWVLDVAQRTGRALEHDGSTQ